MSVMACECDGIAAEHMCSLYSEAGAVPVVRGAWSRPGLVYERTHVALDNTTAATHNMPVSFPSALQEALKQSPLAVPGSRRNPAYRFVYVHCIHTVVI